MLNPELDIEALRTRFRERGRLQIEDALQGDIARALHGCLAREVPWTLAYIGEQGSTTLGQKELAGMAPAERQRLENAIHERAGREFQFLYDSYMMVTAYKEGRDPGLALHRVLEYLNSAEFLGFARRVTGVEAIRKADAQATRYVAGHFLNLHNDFNSEQRREVAYVLNLTRDWRADWGGLLHFADGEGNVIDTFMPRFNTLTLFRVPAYHFVSHVAPYAQGARYAITGWLRSD